MVEFVVFDTEFTAWPGSRERQWSEPWEHRELIQMAAVKVSVVEQRLQITETFNELVTPVINSQLSDYITQLTGITQTMIQELAVDFSSVLRQFHQFCHYGELPGFSWGNDVNVLRENCMLNSVGWPEFHAGLKDIKPFLRNSGIQFGEINSGGLAKSLGLEVAGQEHNALHDVRSIVAALQHWVFEDQLDIESLATS